MTNTNPTLERGTYEIIRNRLATDAEDLRARLERLNTARRDVFGAIETKLLSSARITTDNNCVVAANGLGVCVVKTPVPIEDNCRQRTDFIA